MPRIYERRPIEERFWSHVDKNGPIPAARPDLGPCWIWTAKGRDGNGYAAITTGGHAGKFIKVHRFSYELHKGPIFEGPTIDHLCFVRDCVNPDHLEAVTLAINVLRSRNGVSVRAAMATHCPSGHPYDLFNTMIHISGSRRCATCNKASASAWRQRKVSEGAPRDEHGRVKAGSR